MKVKSLGYIGIETTDPSSWRTFATEILGLMDNTKEGDANLYFGMDEKEYRIIIIPGEKDRFRFSGWEMKNKNDFDETLDRLKVSGHPVERNDQGLASKRLVTEIAKTSDPDGNEMELYYGRVQSYKKFNSPIGVSKFVTGNMGMGHVVLPTPSLAKCLTFYSEILGFEESDYMDIILDPTEPAKGLHFLHSDNPRHHSLALFETEHAAGLIHMMIEVENIDEVGCAIDRCIENDVHITASLGRHTNDQMVSFYMRCPSGFEVEYGCSGLQVDWKNHIPTTSLSQDFWGHKFDFPKQ